MKQFYKHDKEQKPIQRNVFKALHYFKYASIITEESIMVEM